MSTQRTARSRRRFASPPCRHLRAEVTRVTRLTPHMARITFGGDDLAAFSSAGPDQRIKLFLPQPGQEEPVYPTDATWWLTWREMPEVVRATFRSYTIRRHRPEHREVDIDFVLHGDTGPASRWASRAQPGDRVGIWGPASDYDPPAGADRQLIVGDETALPAIGAIVESLPASAKACVFVEVADVHEEQRFRTAGDVELSWLHRDGVEAGRSDVLVRAVQNETSKTLPPDSTYAWIAGESGTVRALRRHLVTERGFNREAVYFSGYWRRGKAEDGDD